LRGEIYNQPDRDIAKIRPRKGIQKTLEMNACEKKGQKPSTDQDFRQQNKQWPSFFHSFIGG
jgi:hypothetical protein